MVEYFRAQTGRGCCNPLIDGVVPLGPHVRKLHMLTLTLILAASIVRAPTARATAAQVGSIEGKVLLEDGHPVPGRTIVAVSSDVTPVQVLAAETDDKGCYSIPRVKAGRYVVTLVRADQSTLEPVVLPRTPKSWVTLPNDMKWILGKKAKEHSPLHQVSAQGRTVVDFALPPAVSVLVKLRGGDSAFDGVRLSLEDVSEFSMINPELVQESNAEGEARWKRVFAGAYRLRAEVGDWEVGLGLVQLTKGRREITRVVGRHQMALRIKNALGEPAKRMHVAVQGRGGDRWIGVERLLLRPLRSQDGVYAVPHLSAGKYDVHVFAGETLGYAEVVVGAEVRKTPPTIITLRHLGQMRVTVKTGDGEPVKGALVRLTTKERTWMTLTVKTDQSGSVVEPVYPATWTAELMSAIDGTAKAEVLARKTVDVASGRVSSVALIARPHKSSVAEAK